MSNRQPRAFARRSRRARLGDTRSAVANGDVIAVHPVRCNVSCDATKSTCVVATSRADRRSRVSSEHASDSQQPEEVERCGRAACAHLPRSADRRLDGGARDEHRDLCPWRRRLAHPRLHQREWRPTHHGRAWVRNPSTGCAGGETSIGGLDQPGPARTCRERLARQALPGIWAFRAAWSSSPAAADVVCGRSARPAFRTCGSPRAVGRRVRHGFRGGWAAVAHVRRRTHCC